MPHVLLARVGLALQRLDAHLGHLGHLGHQRAHMLAADLEALSLQHVAQHPCARERVVEVQLVDAPNQPLIGLALRGT